MEKSCGNCCNFQFLYEGAAECFAGHFSERDFLSEDWTIDGCITAFSSDGCEDWSEIEIEDD